MIITEEDYLAHYGTLHKSGRYPWGSGETQSERNKSFLGYVHELKRKGLSDAEVAKGLGEDWSSTKLRALTSIAKNEEKQANIARAQRLKDKGNSNTEIGRQMGAPESTIRSWLAPGEKVKVDQLQTISTMLKDHVDRKRFVDIGSGVSNQLGITDTKLNTAVAILKEQGYKVHRLKSPQVGTGLDTEYKILGTPDSEQREIFLDRSKIQQITDYSGDGGITFTAIQKPIALHPDRVNVVYGPEGGDKADGVMFVRPGVKDVSLDKASYAQVRVQVGDGHYLKGMAMYKNDLPKGVDVQFNTVKTDTGNKLDAMKKLERDPSNPDEIHQDNPFGTFIRRQITEKDTEGKDHVTSAMNIVNEEGDWLKWSKSIASQTLSKQSPALAKSQLDMTFERRKQEFADIMSMTNPTVRKRLLKDFAGSVDAAAVHLKAAALPRQGWHAILPIDSLKPTEIYAPNFKPGERVVLIRYPHGGTFEIPELTVNNKHPEAKSLLGGARDAVGIHSSVAERLSGADFDGDTVLVIPNNSGRIKTTPALEGLKGFNARTAYPEYPGMSKMKNTQMEMGKISNLVTDMTIRGADTPDLARAIRHAMVVIDAEKHGLNYRQSYKDNGIKQLVEKYQSNPDGSHGASTLISRAKSRQFVEDRKDRLAKNGGPIDPVTGERRFEPTGRTNFRTGEAKQVRSTKLAEATDARSLSSGTRIENIYADHSNRLKAMANQVRLAELKTPPLKYSPSAKKVYAKEVESLNSKLSIAKRNNPLERQAQLIANTMVKAKRDADPNMDPVTLRKIRFLAQEEARARMGARKNKIEFTQSEWDAIQAGAISDSKLSDMLDNANMDNVRAHAKPKFEPKMTTAKTIRAQQMLDDGYSRAEVASHLGVSTTTLDLATHGE